MRFRRSCFSVVPWFLLLTAVSVAQTRPRIEIVTQNLPPATLGRPYSTTIVTRNGVGPYRWRLMQGKLPPGILLQPVTGILSGAPTMPGTYKFTVAVTDRSRGYSAVREFTLEVLSTLTIRWKQPPTLDSNVLSGSVIVANTSSDPYDLTVVIMAVNENGRATALGYQHFNLNQQIEQAIPFSSLLPNGNYTVHADAVAEIPARNIIRRARIQTPQPITVNVNR